LVPSPDVRAQPYFAGEHLVDFGAGRRILAQGDDRHVVVHAAQGAVRAVVEALVVLVDRDRAGGNQRIRGAVAVEEDAHVVARLGDVDVVAVAVGVDAMARRDDLALADQGARADKGLLHTVFHVADVDADDARQGRIRRVRIDVRVWRIRQRARGNRRGDDAIGDASLRGAADADQGANRDDNTQQFGGQHIPIPHYLSFCNDSLLIGDAFFCASCSNAQSMPRGKICLETITYKKLCLIGNFICKFF
jgi:hypothetical protein